jgi:hypothetical protein
MKGARSRRRKRRFSARGWESYWGYLLLLLLIPVWSSIAAGPGLIGPLFILVLSLVDAYYFLFKTPMVVCGAPKVGGGTCPNNTSGFLLGCWIYTHKWDRVRTVLRFPRWQELRKRLCPSFHEALATLGTMATIASAMAAWITLLVKLVFKL